jgi:hypothetical protein
MLARRGGVLQALVVVGRSGDHVPLLGFLREVLEALFEILEAQGVSSWSVLERGISGNEEIAEGIKERQAGVFLDEQELARLVHFEEHVSAFGGHDEVEAAEDDAETS